MNILKIKTSILAVISTGLFLVLWASSVCAGSMADMAARLGFDTGEGNSGRLSSVFSRVGIGGENTAPSVGASIIYEEDMTTRNKEKLVFTISDPSIKRNFYDVTAALRSVRKANVITDIQCDLLIKVILHSRKDRYNAVGQREKVLRTDKAFKDIISNAHIGNNHAMVFHAILKGTGVNNRFRSNDAIHKLMYTRKITGVQREMLLKILHYCQANYQKNFNVVDSYVVFKEMLSHSNVERSHVTVVDSILNESSDYNHFNETRAIQSVLDVSYITELQINSLKKIVRNARISKNRDIDNDALFEETLYN